MTGKRPVPGLGLKGVRNGKISDQGPKGSVNMNLNSKPPLKVTIRLVITTVGNCQIFLKNKEYRDTNHKVLGSPQIPYLNAGIILELYERSQVTWSSAMLRGGMEKKRYNSRDTFTKSKPLQNFHLTINDDVTQLTFDPLFLMIQKHWIVILQQIAFCLGKHSRTFCGGSFGFWAGVNHLDTLPKTNEAPENWWLEDAFLFGAYFQGRFAYISQHFASNNSRNPRSSNRWKPSTTRSASRLFRSVLVATHLSFRTP